MARGDLNDEQYERLRPLLPSSAGKPGRPYEDHRKVVNGILWRLRTGAPWRDLPERYGPWQTCHARLILWQRDGTWDRLLAHVQTKSDAVGDVIWEVSIDSSVVRVHQHVAGARKRGAVRTRPTKRSGPAGVA